MVTKGAARPSCVAGNYWIPKHSLQLFYLCHSLSARLW